MLPMLAFGQVLYVKPLRFQLAVTRALGMPAIGTYLGHHAPATDLAVARHIEASGSSWVQREDILDWLTGVRMEDGLFPGKDGSSQFRRRFG